MGHGSVRSASPEDLPAIRDVVTGAGLPVDGIGEHWRDFFVVVDDGGAIVGVAGLEIYEGAALLRSVVVSPDARGGGIARDLVRACLARAEDRGAREVYLLTNTAEDYFLRFGFQTVARDAIPAAVQRSVEFTSAACAGALCMRRILGER